MSANTPAWLYSPKTNFDYKREGLDDVPTMIEREVLWRYVGTVNTVAIFRTSDELDKDIAYRVKICQTARTGGLPAFPNPAIGVAGMSKANANCWSNGELDKGPKSGVSWFTALTDVFHLTNGPTLYAMGCNNTARCFHLLAANTALGELEFNNRRGSRRDVATINSMFMNRNAAAGQVIFKVDGSTVGESAAVYDWLPGDWAEFDNVDIPETDPIRSVENVIYIGGCFEQTVTGFKATAQFIGNPMGKVSMANMIQQVSTFKLNGADNTSDVLISPVRKMFRQPSL